MKRVEVLPGRRSNSSTYHYEGWTLHRVTARADPQGVVGRFVCSQERKGANKYCPYTLTILGDPEANTATYLESGQHLDPCNPYGYIKHRFEQHVEWRMCNRNCKDRHAFKVIYDEVKAEQNLHDMNLTPTNELYQKMLKKRLRAKCPEPTSPNTGTVFPYKQPTDEEGKIVAQEAAKSKQAFADLKLLKDRRDMLMSKLTNCRRQKAEIEAFASIDWDARNNALPPKPDYEVISDNGDIQVIKPHVPPDYLKTARPGREFPLPLICYICNDAPSRALFLSCRKVSMCPNCAAKVVMQFNRCTCCNSSGVLDKDGNIRMQIVY